MSRFGVNKPVIFLDDDQIITGWAQNGTRTDITITDPNVVAGNHIRISGTPEYDGSYEVYAVNVNDVTIVLTWAGAPTADGTGQKCWDMNLDDTLVYYIPDFENALIVNESPINGHISTVNLADDTDEGRFKLDLTLNNLTATQYAKFEDMRALSTMDILIHEDDLQSLGALNFTLLKYKEFAGANYPLIDNVIVNLISTDYEQIK